jgi:hypothetical protein
MTVRIGAGIAVPHGSTHDPNGTDALFFGASGEVLISASGTVNGIGAFSGMTAPTAVSLTNQTYHLTAFTAPLNFTMTKFVYCPNAAGANILTFKVGLYLLSASNNWLFVASTGDLGSNGSGVANSWTANVTRSDTIAFAGATHTTVGSSAQLVRGSRYTIVYFSYGTSSPTQPKLYGLNWGQTVYTVSLLTLRSMSQSTVNTDLADAINGPSQTTFALYGAVA